MSKKDEVNKQKNVKKLNPDTNPIIHRRARMETLSKKIMQTIESESKVGTFSIFEIIEVLVKCLHSYNKRFITNEHQNLQAEFDKKQSQDSNKN